MKLISYRYQDQDSYGAVQGDRVIDLRAVFGTRAADLKALIAADLLAEAAQAAAQAKESLPLADVQRLPVIPNPGKIVCVGLNYGEHVRETGRTVTEQPTLFLRVAE